MQKGRVHVYTGDGKGKTTAMLGLALRAYGAGLRVYIGQFMKYGDFSEVKAIKKYLPGITLEQYGEGRILCSEITEQDRRDAADGLKKAEAALLSGNYDVIMLDEINVAVHFDLLNVSDVLELIRLRPGGVELILTGRRAKPEVAGAADLVSEINMVKHYYDDNTEAREGIEK